MEEGRNFCARYRVDTADVTNEIFERREKAFVVFRDGKTILKIAHGGIPRQRGRFLVQTRFEDDSDRIFREAFFQLQGKEDGDFDSRRSGRGFFEEPAFGVGFLL